MFGTIEGLKAKNKGERVTFGFIIGEDGQKYFFLPMTMALPAPVPFEQLALGQGVQFTPVQHERGPRAIDVRAVITRE